MILLLILNRVDKSIDILSETETLNSEMIKEFVSEYLNVYFTIYKKMWANQYELENKLNDVGEETDVLDWINSNLGFPNVIVAPNYQHTQWDKLLEGYIRAFSMNLVKNQGSYYLRINNGSYISQHNGLLTIKQKELFLMTNQNL